MHHSLNGSTLAPSADTNERTRPLTLPNADDPIDVLLAAPPPPLPELTVMEPAVSLAGVNELLEAT